MEPIFYWSQGLDFLFLWALFLAIIIFSVWAYIFSKWNSIGPKWKQKFSKNNKEKKRNDEEILKEIEQKIEMVDSKPEQLPEGVSLQELLRLQSEKEKIEKKQLKQKESEELSRIEKEKELVYKEQLKSKGKSKKGKKLPAINSENNQIIYNSNSDNKIKLKNIEKHSNLNDLLKNSEKFEKIIKK